MEISIFDAKDDAYWWVLCTEKYFQAKGISEERKMIDTAKAMRGLNGDPFYPLKMQMRKRNSRWNYNNPWNTIIQNFTLQVYFTNLHQSCKSDNQLRISRNHCHPQNHHPKEPPDLFIAPSPVPAPLKPPGIKPTLFSFPKSRDLMGFTSSIYAKSFFTFDPGLKSSCGLLLNLWPPYSNLQFTKLRGDFLPHCVEWPQGPASCWPLVPRSSVARSFHVVFDADHRFLSLALKSSDKVVLLSLLWLPWDRGRKDLAFGVEFGLVEEPVPVYDGDRTLGSYTNCIATPYLLTKLDIMSILVYVAANLCVLKHDVFLLSKGEINIQILNTLILKIRLLGLCFFKDFGTSIFDIQLVLPWHEWKLMQLQKRKAKEFHDEQVYNEDKFDFYSNTPKFAHHHNHFEGFMHFKYKEEEISFSLSRYDLILLIEELLKTYETVAYYVAAKCGLIITVRDGMNPIPYKSLVSRIGNDTLDKLLLGLASFLMQKSMFFVSVVHWPVPVVGLLIQACAHFVLVNIAGLIAHYIAEFNNWLSLIFQEAISEPTICIIVMVTS
ncbi:alphaalpha-trehalose-phosphate synthase [Trifolium medium]|uniref:Alphaalpha-trehalose-phosphate synthase n=1 Tax=Trifolium medium TaxID=97028 RepID=A0A392M7V6_9FABA|nr:alphaalpha-trehalose-phosphate synthase [Trifolium medium]